jgi:2'-5' RNA ligase
LLKVNEAIELKVAVLKAAVLKANRQSKRAMPTPSPPTAAFSRFFVALLPPQNVEDYANEIIQLLNQQYQTRTAKAPPHITLQPPFLWQRGKLSNLSACLETVVQSQPAVPVRLVNFGAFAPRVLYINVEKTPELLALQAKLMQQLEQSLGIVDPMAKRRAFTPHLTIASRNVTRQTFRQAWADLQTRQVEFDFICDRLTLLLHDGDRWQIHCEFPFVKIF